MERYMTSCKDGQTILSLGILDIQYFSFYHLEYSRQAPIDA